MSKQEFLANLKAELSFISLDEKEDAIKYYEEYFEDAGEENEQAILIELGSPKELSLKILDDLGYTKDGLRKSKIGNIELKLVETIEEIDGMEKIAEVAEIKEVEQVQEIPKAEQVQKIEEVKEIKEAEEIIELEEIDVSENKTTDTTDTGNKQAPPKYNTAPQQKQNNPSNKLLIVVLLVLSSPIWAPIFFGMLAVVVALFFTFFGVSISFFCAAIGGAAAAISGIGLIVYGVFMVFSNLLAALTAIGSGFLCLGAGMIIGYIFFRLSILLFKWQFKITAKLFKVIFGAIGNMFSGRRHYNAA